MEVIKYLSRQSVKIVFIFLLPALFSGCLRLQAGTWQQGPGDEAPKVHQVTLDTQQLVQGRQAPGDITV